MEALLLGLFDTMLAAISLAMELSCVIASWIRRRQCELAHGKPFV